MLPAVRMTCGISLAFGKRMSISSTATLSSSAAICASPMEAFWPISARGQNIRQRPSGRICSHAAPASSPGMSKLGRRESTERPAK